MTGQLVFRSTTRRGDPLTLSEMKKQKKTSVITNKERRWGLDVEFVTSTRGYSAWTSLSLNVYKWPHMVIKSRNLEWHEQRSRRIPGPEKRNGVMPPHR